jgi:ATP-dependent Clp protease ATP-binding subunit ClpB
MSTRKLGVKMSRKNPATVLDPGCRSKEAVEFEEALHRKIVGQDQAIEKVSEIYQIFLAGLNAPGRPIGNLLFLGPTGTGKTRVVEAMAEAMLGDEKACIKIDCGEFQHSHEIAKLIGSPPGYLGHRETHPLLTQEALDHWHTDKRKVSILLFDEIEKASDALWQLLLGILDKGTLTLGDNRRVDLSRCIIIMTSNLGAREMSDLTGADLGFAATPKVVETGVDDKMDRIAVEAARRKFVPEFMNRIDKVVVFKTLRPEHLRTILDIELRMVQRRILMTKGAAKFSFSCTEDAKQFLLREGTDSKYGARHLKRAIEKNLVFPLANLVTSGQVKLGDFVRVGFAPEREMTFVKASASVLPTIVPDVAETAAASAMPAPKLSDNLKFNLWPI